MNENNSAVPTQALRVLILGGTGQIGPHYVHAAVERGHQVAVFNRGKSQAALPQGVESLVGDRDSDLKSIRQRDWDVVLDLGTLVPSRVRSIGEALNGRVKHYTFISTCAVYDNSAIAGKIGEDSPYQVYRGSADPYSVSSPDSVAEYGALKVLCEREAEQQFPRKTLILRPGYIVGPGDPQGYLVYWPVRMKKGGEVLVAGDPSMAVQFIDVRDLAAWNLHLAEQGATGIYNAAGPTTPITLSQVVSAARDAASPSPKLTWVPASWLAAQNDGRMWNKLLFWTFEPEGWAWSMQLSIERALAAGLTTRPLSVTLADMGAWFSQQPAERQADLLSFRRLDEVEKISWPAYLEREREILISWSRTHS